MINEMTEALAAIDIYKETGHSENLCEELGDVLLQVVLLAQIAEEEGRFAVEDVVRGISRKMIRRHPHVFGEVSAGKDADKAAADADDSGEASLASGKVLAKEIPGQWEAIKRAEKKNRTPEMERKEKEAFKAAAGEVIRHLEKKCR